MKRDEFLAAVRESFEETHGILEKAQVEYSDPENAFAEFEATADLLGITREQVLGVYLNKHVRGLFSWIRGNKLQRDSVHGRVADVTNYVAILSAMAKQAEEEAHTRPDLFLEEKARDSVFVKVSELWTIALLAQHLDKSEEEIRDAYDQAHNESEIGTLPEIAPNHYALSRSNVRGICRVLGVRVV